MTSKFAAAMRRAAKATHAFNVSGATRLIQRTLATSLFPRLVASSSKKHATAPAGARSKANARSKAPANSKALAKTSETSSQGKTRQDGATAAKPSTQKTSGRAASHARLRRPLGEVLETLRSAGAAMQMPVGGLSGMPFGATSPSPAVPLPKGARFVSRSFTCREGARDYKIYVPASAPEKPRGLVVMLHGCKQNPDDFAAGTSMNAVAEMHGLLVAYPEQTRSNNVSSCWNWFEQGHQLRNAGEPAIIAGLTRELIKEFKIDRDQVFVAGLSAGGAMAVVMGATYPDLFRAVGVHSGLAYQSAGNVMSALAVMRGSAGSGLFGNVPTPVADVKPMRTIIFHGTADRTVHLSNAERIFDMASVAGKNGMPSTTGSINGRRVSKTVIAVQGGVPLVERWLIDGAGHAWSGGSKSGSYTDTQGPDASAEFVRFFLKQSSR